MAQLTIVGETMASPGKVFRFTERCEVAASCPIAHLCQNQETGRQYRIVAVRPVHHDVCQVFEGGARVVEVEPLPVEATMPASKLKGTLAVWEPPLCTKRWCPNWDVCFTPAARKGTRYAAADPRPVECPMGYDLRRVRLTPTT